MKKRQLKIKLFLFCSLVLILGILIALYLAFCRGGDYNRFKIETSTETTTETTTESTTESTSTTEEQETESLTEEETEASTEASTSWDNYDPATQLAGENWALTLINKTYTLDKKYTPTLSPVLEGSSVTADTRVAEAYKVMYEDALKEGVVLTPYSGYCSWNRQQTNFDNKVQAFMLQGMTNEEAIQNAEKRIEPAGCSENNAGLSVDIGSASAGFSSTAEYKWLTENAFKYGFILRYPENKTDITGMIFQPWHWRYVGVDPAVEMKNNNQCLEEYLNAQ